MIKKLLWGLAGFIGILPVLLVLGIPLLFIVTSVREYSEVEQQLTTFYREAGFVGHISEVFTEQQGLSTFYSYAYEENIGGKPHTITFPAYFDRELKGSEVRSVEQLVANYDSGLLLPFFEQGLSFSETFSSLASEAGEAVSRLGGHVAEVPLSGRRAYDDTGLKKDEIKASLQADLQALQDTKVTELRGISQLDLLKYLDLGMLEVVIYLSPKSSSFTVSQLDASQLPNGYYQIFGLDDEGLAHYDESFRVVNGELVFLGRP